MRKVGILVHPRWATARELAQGVEGFFNGLVHEVWQAPAWDDEGALERIPGTDLLICLGGDGVMLWAARTVIPHPVPVLGVNMGRLGFLAELRPQDLLDRLPDVLEGRCRIEERAMLQAQVPTLGIMSHALNDVVVGRAFAGKPVYMDISIDRSRLALYRCDAVIVASATGSTAYSLSAGGPILHPESREMLLTPVAPHLAAARSLVLPAIAEIDLVVDGEFGTVVSIDGQVDRPLARGDRVSVCRSPHLARFVRMVGREDHYAILGQQLDWLRASDVSKQRELFGLTEAETK